MQSDGTQYMKFLIMISEQASQDVCFAVFPNLTGFGLNTREPK